LFDKRLHLLDDGTLPGGLRTTAFDDRGVTPVPLTLLREGWVNNRFFGPEEARQRGARPTGHAVGEGQRPTNLQLRAGTRSMNALLADVSDPVFVLDHVEDIAGVDLRTGKIEVLGGGTFIRAGKPVGCAYRVQVTGDLVDVLSRVVDVASDTDRVGSVDAPGLLVDGLSIA
jgi:PmbA protein